MLWMVDRVGGERVTVHRCWGCKGEDGEVTCSGLHSCNSVGSHGLMEDGFRISLLVIESKEAVEGLWPSGDRCAWHWVLGGSL